MGYFDDIVPTQDVGGPDYFADIIPQPVSTARDVVQSIPQYGETLASSTVGLPGDVANLASMGVSAVGGPEMPHYTGSADIQNYFNEAQGGPLYQPQTPIGKTGNVAAGLGPAMLGGPEAAAAKIIPRVLAPAAAITGIEASPLPESVKPWAEVATTVLAPFGANPAVRTVLNQTKRAVSALPGRGGEIGVLPTTSELAKAKTALEQIRDTASSGRTKRMAQDALDEVTARHRSMEVLDQATGGNASRARYGKNIPQFREDVSTLLSEINKGQHKGVFTPEQIAQMKTVVEGSPGMKLMEKAEKVNPFHSLSHLGGAGILGFLATKVVEGSGLHAALIGGSATAIALVAKAAYPHLTARQINKLVGMVQRGAGRSAVPGAPAAFGRRPDLTYSPLQVPLATGLVPQDQGNQ